MQISWQNGLPVIERWAASDCNTEIREESEADAVEVGHRIRRLFHEYGFHGKLVAHSVCGKSVVPQYFNFPQLLPADVADAVRIEVESALPFAAQSTLVDHLLFPEQQLEGEKSRTHGVAIAADNEHLQCRLQAIKYARLETFCVEADATACANAFAATHNLPELSGTTAILNIGHEYSNLSLLAGENRLLMRDITWGGQQFTSRIAEHLGISKDEAKAMKERHWTEGPAKAATLDQCLPDLLDSSTQELVTRMRDTIHYWIGERLVPRMERMFVTGGGSQVRGMPEFLSEMFSVPVEHWSPITNTGEESSRIHAQWDYRLTVAFGLALRKF